jgi:hypothetical protein
MMRMRELGLSQLFTEGVEDISGNTSGEQERASQFEKASSEVGSYSAETLSRPPSSPTFSPACAQGSPRFEKGNPWRWKPGQSGNPRGRPQRNAREDQRDAQLSLAVQEILLRLEIMGKLATLEGYRPPPRLVRFKVLYEITHNAHRSALIAGYSPKTAKSKAYLLARQVTGI